MKVGLAAATPHEIALLRRAADHAGLEIAFSVGTTSELLASTTPVPLVLLAHGALDAASCARHLADRGVAVVLWVTDATASVDALYRAISSGGIELAQTSDALGPILARHVRGARTAAPTSRAVEVPVLAIAASAGGPDALAEVLRDLSPDLPLRVIVAQHIEPPFTSGLATWLAARAMRRVEIADEGRALDTEAVLLVRSDRQPFVDRRGIVRYRALDPANPFHPCIDALLTSLAEAPSLRGAAALLTGMGADGAAGLLALRRVGWVTIAQDAATSKVFGMPRAAAELGAASLVVPLDRIGATASRALRADVGARP